MVAREYGIPAVVGGRQPHHAARAVDGELHAGGDPFRRALCSPASSHCSRNGPGRYSLDRLLGHRLNQPWITAAAFAAVTAATIAVQARPPPDPVQHHHPGPDRSLTVGSTDKRTSIKIISRALTAAWIILDPYTLTELGYGIHNG